MSKYHKINTLYKRDMSNNGKLIVGDWAEPELEYLKDNLWVWTEKIDGTNIRIDYNPENKSVNCAGRTDRAIIPKHLMAYLERVFALNPVFSDFNAPVTLYGEGYGVKIQKGHNYIPDAAEFILFDVRIGRWWLTRDDVDDIAEQFKVKSVPIVGEGTLAEAVKFVSGGFLSEVAANSEYEAEGIVARPLVELSSRSGRRIITKIKTCDFK